MSQAGLLELGRWGWVGTETPFSKYLNCFQYMKNKNR